MTKCIIVCALIGFLVAGCASNDPTPGPSDISLKRDAWSSCVISSFKAHRNQTADANTAVELAFTSCQTEEQAIITHLNDPQFSYEASRLMVQHKANLKRAILAQVQGS